MKVLAHYLICEDKMINEYKIFFDEIRRIHPQWYGFSPFTVSEKLGRSGV